MRLLATTGRAPETPEALAEVADLLNRNALLPPAEAAFRDRFGITAALAAYFDPDTDLEPGDMQAIARDTPGPTPAEIEELRGLAERILRGYIADGENSPEWAAPGALRRCIALRYAEALACQGEILDRFEHLDAGAHAFQAGLERPERDRVEEFLLYRSLMASFQTVDTLVDRWERCVGWLEDRAMGVVYDEFVDSLNSRDSLDAVPRLLSRRPRDVLQRRIDDADRRFEAATEQLDVSMRAPFRSWESQGWWWFRAPPGLGPIKRTPSP